MPTYRLPMFRQGAGYFRTSKITALPFEYGIQRDQWQYEPRLVRAGRNKTVGRLVPAEPSASGRSARFGERDDDQRRSGKGISQSQPYSRQSAYHVAGLVTTSPRSIATSDSNGERLPRVPRSIYQEVAHIRQSVSPKRHQGPQEAKDTLRTEPPDESGSTSNKRDTHTARDRSSDLIIKYRGLVTGAAPRGPAKDTLISRSDNTYPGLSKKIDPRAFEKKRLPTGKSNQGIRPTNEQRAQNAMEVSPHGSRGSERLLSKPRQAGSGPRYQDGSSFEPMIEVDPGNWTGS